MRKHKASLILLLLSTFFSLGVAETALLSWEAYYPQVNKVNDYGDIITIKIRDNHPGTGGFLEPNYSALVRGGYGNKVRWRNNNFGFRSDYDITKRRPKGVLRILSLGDSFTAGYRVDQHSSFSYVLEQWLRKQSIPVQVLVAETEEPASALYYYTTHGRSFEPQIVLLGITLGNDIAQALYYLGSKYNISSNNGGYTISVVENFAFKDYWRGQLFSYNIPEECLRGDEAETIDQNQKPFKLPLRSRLLERVRRSLDDQDVRSTPWPVNSCLGGHVPKLFDACHGLGHYLKNPPEVIEESYSKLFNILSAFQTFTREDGVELVVLIFPQRFQVQSGDWVETVKAYRLCESCFDLDSPNRQILEFCKKQELRCIDPTKGMVEAYQERGRSLYFPYGDMHWNAEGHEVYADIIKNEVLNIIASSSALAS